MKEKLNDLGWKDVNDKAISSDLANIRRTKLVPANLSGYVAIENGKNNKNEYGYKLLITMP